MTIHFLRTDIKTGNRKHDPWPNY